MDDGPGIGLSGLVVAVCRFQPRIPVSTPCRRCLRLPRRARVPAPVLRWREVRTASRSWVSTPGSVSPGIGQCPGYGQPGIGQYPGYRAVPRNRPVPGLRATRKSASFPSAAFPPSPGYPGGEDVFPAAVRSALRPQRWHRRHRYCRAETRWMAVVNLRPLSVPARPPPQDLQLAGDCQQRAPSGGSRARPTRDEWTEIIKITPL